MAIINEVDKFTEPQFHQVLQLVGVNLKIIIIGRDIDYINVSMAYREDKYNLLKPQIEKIKNG